MTPEALAQLHAAAFLRERPWKAAEFASLLESPHVTLFARPGGFALVRTIADESELLTLAVDPAQQRQGIARDLMEQWLTSLPSLIQSAFLEVAADNEPALTLYRACRFEVAGRRAAYYARPGAPPADALLMRRALTHGQTT